MLVFATGNDRKITEARGTLGSMGIIFDVQAIDTHEIQHNDPAEIAMHKARSAYDVIKHPVVVSDTSWDIPALGGFPGGYMKDIANWWNAKDWLSVMARHEDRRIICLEHVAFYDGSVLQHFEHRYEGLFTSELPSELYGESFENVVILYGGQTMSEQLRQGMTASAGEDLFHWRKFGEWYKKYDATV